MTGFFGIGIYYSKNNQNLGSLFRTAYSLDASYIYTIGRKYSTQASDTTKTMCQIPYYHYDNMGHFLDSVPKGSRVVGIEISEDSRPIKNYIHPKRACYLLGNEGTGIPNSLLDHCHDIVELPGKHCHNVAVAGACTLMDRVNKLN